MKIVIAPDSFKESMTAQEVCDFIEKGMKKVLKDATFVKVPMADGGEGTTQSLVDATNGKMYLFEVTGPLGEKVTSKLGILGDGNTAILEMASASGLELVPREKRNPMITTTYGTGELIKKALDLGVKTVLIAIGGAYLTYEKAQEVIDNLEKKGKISVDEGKRLKEELIQKKDHYKKDALSRDEMEAQLIEMSAAHRKDIDELEKKVEDLTRKVEERSN